jgi:general stress protein 26
MSDPLTPQEAEREFWRHLKSSNTGMLGLDRPGEHLQPMTAFREEETGSIWFFTRDDTDLARAVATGEADALFTYASKDQEVWASIHGRLSTQHDPERIHRWWNPVVAAWYPDGPDDPHLTLLRLDGGDGRIWVSMKGPIRFGLEVLKANMTGELPDAGGRADVRLD